MNTVLDQGPTVSTDNCECGCGADLIVPEEEWRVIPLLSPEGYSSELTTRSVNTGIIVDARQHPDVLASPLAMNVFHRRDVLIDYGLHEEQADIFVVMSLSDEELAALPLSALADLINSIAGQHAIFTLPDPLPDFINVHKDNSVDQNRQITSNSILERLYIAANTHQNDSNLIREFANQEAELNFRITTDPILVSARENWDKIPPDPNALSDEEKIAIVDFVLEIQAEIYGIDKPNLIVVNELDSTGYYRPNEGSVLINRGYIVGTGEFSSRGFNQVMRTTIHEGVHHRDNFWVEEFRAGRISPENPFFFELAVLNSNRSERVAEHGNNPNESRANQLDDIGLNTGITDPTIIAQHSITNLEKIIPEYSFAWIDPRNSKIIFDSLQTEAQNLLDLEVEIDSFSLTEDQRMMAQAILEQGEQGAPYSQLETETLIRNLAQANQFVLTPFSPVALAYHTNSNVQDILARLETLDDIVVAPVPLENTNASHAELINNIVKDLVAEAQNILYLDDTFTSVTITYEQRLVAEEIVERAEQGAPFTRAEVESLGENYIKANNTIIIDSQSIAPEIESLYPSGTNPETDVFAGIISNIEPTLGISGTDPKPIIIGDYDELLTAKIIEAASKIIKLNLESAKNDITEPDVNSAIRNMELEAEIALILNDLEMNLGNDGSHALIIDNNLVVIDGVQTAAIQSMFESAGIEINADGNLHEELAALLKSLPLEFYEKIEGRDLASDPVLRASVQDFVDQVVQQQNEPSITNIGNKMAQLNELMVDAANDKNFALAM